MKLPRRVRALFQKPKLDADMTEEMRTHVELQTQANRDAGMAPEEACYAAQRQFGHADGIKEQCRDGRGGRWVEDFFQDLRYGVRMLRKYPGLTFIAILALALGTGVNTTLFTICDGIFLRKLPVPDSAAVRTVWGVNDRDGSNESFSYPDYLDYCEHNEAFSGLAVWRMVATSVSEGTTGSADVTVQAGTPGITFQSVSANYFEVLKAPMALGRAFLPGTADTQDIVLSYGFWQRNLNSDPGVIGKTVRLDLDQFTIVGVAAPEFTGMIPVPPIGWVPITPEIASTRAITDRNARLFQIVGRLKPGVSRVQAQAGLEVIARQQAHDFPAKNRITRLSVSSGLVPLNPPLLLVLAPLAGVFGLVLVLACANVANLLLARSATRHHEIGIRLTVGATRGRLIRQLLTESILLAGLGGAAGLFVAVLLTQTLAPLIIAQFPPQAGAGEWLMNLHPNYHVFAYIMLVTLLAGIVAGLMPALQTARADTVSALKDEGPAFGPRWRPSKLRTFLIVTQLAICLALLAPTGSLIHLLKKTATLDFGFAPQHLLVVDGFLGGQTRDAGVALKLRRDLIEKLQALPGVVSVGEATFSPITPRQFAAVPVLLRGQNEDANRSLRVVRNPVSASYFETLGLRIIRGRALTESDTVAGAQVVVVSESTARRFWPGQDAIGRVIGLPVATEPGAAADRGSTPPVFTDYEVVGVAQDVAMGAQWEKTGGVCYVTLPLSRLPGSRQILVSTAGDPRAVLASVHLSGNALGLLLYARTADDIITWQMSPIQGIAQIAGLLGAFALLLAALGLYGVMSLTVNQRVREIGVRIALGATPMNVMALFLRQAGRMIAIGATCGLIGGGVLCWLLTRAVQGMRPMDPVAFSGVTLLLAIVAMLACLLPARRATRVDPMVALRCE